MKPDIEARDLDCFSACSRMTPPLFAEPRHHGTKVTTATEKEAESVCESQCSDWSKDHPPKFSEQSQPDDMEEAPSGLQNDECFNDCALDETGPGNRPKTTSSIESHRHGLRRRFGSVSEGTEEAEHITVLDQVYTELYITNGQSQGLHTQHEVKQLESQLRRNASSDSPIRVHDIFKALSDDNKPIRVVLTNGVAGIGKTFSVSKFTLDWSRALENQDIDLVVPLFFRELNLVRQKCSLLEMVRIFHPDLTDQNSSETLKLKKVVFILDGLDESKLLLEFTCELIPDISQKADVNTLLVNLIRGTLLPNALIWITSRPAAANQIPARWVDRVTEVRGFVTDDQKVEYFSKRFTEEHLCRKVLSHIRTSRSLHTMCQIPNFSWITATVMEHMLRTEDTDTSPLPQSLTHMYAHFLLVLTHRRKCKQENGRLELTKDDREALLKLARLAFVQLQKGNVLFYQDDLQEAGVDLSNSAIDSAVCTKIFKRESALFDKPVYCFVHMSVQEFLAAVYLHHCFTERNVEVLESFLWSEGDESSFLSEDDEQEDTDQPFDLDENLGTFLHEALLKSFKSKSGHLDLLVRFLYGLCLDSNRKPLRYLLGAEWVRPGTVQRALTQLKSTKIRFLCPDRGINVFHCLLEMNDDSVTQETKDFLKSVDRSTKLSEIQCSALAYMLQMSEDVLDELDLSQYNASRDARLRLIPAVKNCTIARISECLLSNAHYEVVVAVLKSDQSPLRTLDFRGNWLQDTGLEALCVGLKSSNCRLETLLLANCRLTMCSCKNLAHILEVSSLKELDLSRNRITDTGVKMLCSFLKIPHGALQTLRLTACGLTDLSCSSLASALQSGSALKCLDLNENCLLDSGLDQLALGLRSPQCKLETLSLTHCELTERSCSSLASALSTSRLTDLDLSYNPIRDSGLTLLCARLQESRVQTLRLRCCLLTTEGIHSLALALKDSQLKDLDLSLNQLRDVAPLRAALQGPHSLRTLRLKDCRISKEDCEALLSTWNSNPQTLTELDLHLNNG